MNEDHEILTDCCGAPFAGIGYPECDICSDCYEHADVSKPEPKPEVKDYCIINHETGCQYMFKHYSQAVKVLIDDGHGWRTYDSDYAAGNYAIGMARLFWNSLIKQGFTTNYD
tara:strand:- start:43 stop:381 length:339 start_codon:yes stop_codon:yes gene_type:complete